MGTASYLGPAGGLIELPPSEAGIQVGDELLGVTHRLVGGGGVQQRSGIGGRARSWSYDWSYLTEAEISALEVLRLRPGPWRLLDGQRRNFLTANQSMCSDLTADRTGMLARFQGILASESTVVRSGGRSIRWDTATALSSTNRGIYWYHSSSTIDATWTAVRPSTQYTFSVYARTSASVNAYAAIDWYTAAGGSPISTSFGASTPLPTSNWNTRLFATALSPPTAAYATGALLNAGTTGAAISVYADDAQLNAGTLADWAVGVGTPEVAVQALSPTYPYIDYLSPSLTLVELSA